MSVVIFTILQKAILMGISHPTHPSINSLTIGSVPCAALPKICLRRLSKIPNFGIWGFVELFIPKFLDSLILEFLNFRILRLRSFPFKIF